MLIDKIVKTCNGPRGKFVSLVTCATARAQGTGRAGDRRTEEASPDMCPVRKPGLK